MTNYSEFMPRWMRILTHGDEVLDDFAGSCMETEMTTIQDDLIAAINEVRTAYSLPPLAKDDGLMGTAQDWAETMARMRILSHGDFAARIAAVHPGDPVGEDAAEGQPDAASVVEAWHSDPRHLQILLGEYDALGIGYAASGQGTTFWCADFARVGGA